VRCEILKVQFPELVDDFFGFQGEPRPGIDNDVHESERTSLLQYTSKIGE